MCESSADGPEFPDSLSLSLSLSLSFESAITL